MELPTPKRDQPLQQLLMVLAFAIPWAKKAIPSIIAFVALIAIIRFLQRRNWNLPKQPTAIITLFALFLLHVVGTLYSAHPSDAWNEVGIKFSFFVFPLLTLLIPTLENEEVRKIKNAFIGGCSLFMAITLMRAGYIAWQHSDWYYITYDRLGWYMHPTYAATYQAFAFYFLIEHWRNNNLSASRKWLIAALMVLTLAFIALLSSKAAYLCMLLIFAYVVYQALKKAAQVTKTIVQVIAAASLFTGIIFILPTTSKRVEYAVQDIQSNKRTDNSSTHTSSTHVRLVTWNAAWNLLIENPFGVGTGDTQYRLNTIYEIESEQYAAERSFNAHNQFLQTGAELGWFGLAALIIILAGIWRMSPIDSTAQLFILLCALNFLFESFLEVQAGIVFFSFWLLVYSRAAKNT